MKKTLTITTYRELFELWSTNNRFHQEYPFLVLLKNAFWCKLEKNDNETSIEVYLRTGTKNQLNDEEFKTYFFPYYDRNYIKDDKIDISNKRRLRFRYFYKYVMDRKLPIVNCSNDDMHWILDNSEYGELKEIAMYLPETNMNGKRFKFRQYYYVHTALYSGTKKECYKPTAYDLLRNITNINASFDSILKFIKENNCVWPDKENSLYTFIKNKEGNCDKVDIVMFLAYNKDKNMWIREFCKFQSHNKYFIDVCKRYNIDINTIVDNGSYLIHYAIQQFNSNPNWLKELLDNGARILDENGELLKGELGWTIYRFLRSDKLHDFLMNYYKDNSVVREKLIEEYEICRIGPKSTPKSVTLTVDVEDPPGDPAINSLISSIQDPIIRDKMTAYYIKLLLSKQ